MTPTSVFKWDGTPQPIKAWQADADVSKALKGSIDWWFARAAQQIGSAPFAAELQKLGYGDAQVTGPITAFWQGPAQHGGLTISTRQQVDFMHRLYAGQLPLKPGVAAVVESLMVADVETDAKGHPVEIDGIAGSCPTEADGSRGVGWRGPGPAEATWPTATLLRNSPVVSRPNPRPAPPSPRRSRTPSPTQGRGRRPRGASKGLLRDLVKPSDVDAHGHLAGRHRCGRGGFGAAWTSRPSAAPDPAHSRRPPTG